METYFSLPVQPEAEVLRMVRTLSKKHAEAAVARPSEDRGHIEVRVQRLADASPTSPVARMILSASALRFATQHDLYDPLGARYVETEVPADAEVLLKYEPGFTVPPRGL